MNGTHWGKWYQSLWSTALQRQTSYFSGNLYFLPPEQHIYTPYKIVILGTQESNFRIHDSSFDHDGEVGISNVNYVEEAEEWLKKSSEAVSSGWSNLTSLFMCWAFPVSADAEEDGVIVLFSGLEPHCGEREPGSNPVPARLKENAIHASLRSKERSWPMTKNDLAGPLCWGSPTESQGF